MADPDPIFAKLVEEAEHLPATDWEAHRRSFAFANVSMENPRVTRELIDAEADRISQTPAE